VKVADDEHGAELNDEDILRRIEHLLEREDEDRKAFKDAILEVAPTYPEPRLDQEYNAYDRLRDHWPESRIREWVDSFATNDVGMPDDAGVGGRPEVETFLWLAGLIAEGEYARTLPEDQMLALIAGKDAATGRDFSRGQAKRAQQPRSPITPILQRLARDRDSSPGELWNQLGGQLDCAGLNPIEVIDTDSGRSDQRRDRYDFDGGHITRGNFYKRLKDLRPPSK
jgi:hypothetical protein